MLSPRPLREELADPPRGRIVVIDEVQKAPARLDEVHWLIENRRLCFALCGSSARRVKRGHANLLGGRALRYELLGLVSDEIGRDFDVVRAVKVRNLPAFSGFLAAAALSDGGLVNFANIARECGVSGPAVCEHLQILVDTLLGRFLPSYTRRPKRRVILAPKFYFADVGVVNHLARRGHVVPGSERFGKAFESWVHHELQACRAYHDFGFDLSFWRVNRRRTADGLEILPARVFAERLWGGELLQE